MLERFDRLPDGLEASRAEKTLALEADRPTIASLGSDGDVVADGGTALDVDEPLREAVYRHRRERVADITAAAVAARERASTIAARLDDLLMNPRTGAPLILALLGLLYLLIGDLVAQRLVDFLEIEVFGALYVPAVQRLVSSVLPSGGLYDPLQYVLINENLGVLTITVQYIVGVLLPLVVAFYLFIGLLEDSGILPRLAVLTDRGLSRIGLNGRAIVPMIVGVGCVTMAVVTTRMVGSRRERLIATGLLGLAIPCSAQLGVILGLLAGLGFGWFLAYLAVLLLVFGVAGLALDRVLPGESEALLTELPRLRRPRLGNILTKTSRRTRMFLREAVPLFGVAALGISVLDYVGGLGAIERALEPVTRLVGLPVEFGQVLVLGVIRRDFAAAGMTDLALSPGQIFVGLVVVTLFVPCILSMVVIGKERGLKAGLVMWLGSWIVALLVGLGVSVVVL